MKGTTTYLNTICKLCDPRELLINLYYTRHPVLTNENLSPNEILIFRRETWHSPRNLFIIENEGYSDIMEQYFL